LAGSPQGAPGHSDIVPRSRTILIRILAGVVLIPVVLVINYWGGAVFAVFACLLAGLASHEFYRLCSSGVVRPSRLVGVLGSVAVCLSFHWGSVETAGLVLTIVVMLILLERLARQDAENYARAVGMTILGLVYTGWLMGFFVVLRDAPDLHGASLGLGGRGPGYSYVLLVLILTWSYDTLAYFGGSFLGRRRLLSRISPAKTVEGTVVGLAAAVAAALVCRAAFAGYLGMVEAALLGFVMGIVAQAGDLVESIVKRSTNTKDSSHLIPGHGGILDRFDSLLFTGPAFYLYLRAVAAWAGR
jgi:phosphatidate cytidylyltransferase